jgi:hypothetical protein
MNLPTKKSLLETGARSWLPRLLAFGLLGLPRGLAHRRRAADSGS